MMSLRELNEFLDQKITGCEELGNMTKEKWAFQQVKKFINSQPEEEARGVQHQKPQKEVCPECNSEYVCYTPDEYYECSTCEHTWTN